MIIKSIKKLSSGKYQVLFDNNTKIITYDEVLLKNNLLYKKELTTEEINDINKENGYYNIYFGLIKFVLRKMRSEKEINKYLEKYELSLNEKNKLIQQLKENGMIDDSKFIKAYISDKLYLSNDGPYKIKNDLLKHDIDEEIIDNEINNIDNEEITKKIKKIIAKKIKNSKGSLFNIKQKIYYDMYNLGYSKEMIESEFNDDIDDSFSLEKDFNKIYNELLKKEIDRTKLYLKVKQKLYQKGYNLAKIEKIINEKK